MVLLRRVTLTLTLIALVVLATGYHGATVAAVQRDIRWRIADWPVGAPPVRLVLLSDLHVVEPDMPTARLAGLVERINRMRPDCVLIAGDLVSDRLLSTRHLAFAEAVAPLAGLRPRIRTIAVLGNHDHWRNGDAEQALRRTGVTVLRNAATRCGAVTIGGVDDIHTRHADVAGTEAAVDRLGGIGVLLSHSPDAFPDMRRSRLMLAGHTHCGQIVLPLVGPLGIPSSYGDRYACGVITERGRSVVVTAGIGTSVVPLRLGAESDFWVVTLGPVA